MIRMEKLDADPLKWGMLFGFFQATVRNQPFSDAEKLTHLQTLTIGKTSQVLAEFACKSPMYTTALDELQKKFGRPDIILNTFIRRLQSFRLPSTHQKFFTHGVFFYR